jgi:hypothetical protein
MSWEDEVSELTRRIAEVVYENEPVDTEAVTQAVCNLLAMLAADLQEQHGDGEALAFTNGVYSALSDAFADVLLEDEDDVEGD